jgi:hypothetical protein
MRRTFAAFAVAALCVLGAASASSAAAHDRPSVGATSVHEATAVVRVVAVAVPAPQLALPFLAVVAVLATAAWAGGVGLAYLARQRRRAVLVPVLASTLRRRGPPVPLVLR